MIRSGLTVVVCVVALTAGCDGPPDPLAVPPTRGTGTVAVIDPTVQESVPTPETPPLSSPQCAIGYEGYLAVLGSINAEDPEVLAGLDDRLRAIGEVLPASLADDIEVLADAYGAYGDAAAESDAPDGDELVQELLDVLDQSRQRDARQALDAYFADRCVSR
jgi:hypothetical protein